MVLPICAPEDAFHETHVGFYKWEREHFSGLCVRARYRATDIG